MPRARREQAAEAGPRLRDNRELLAARLRELPATAGVYLFRGAAGQVLYVGKSASLHDRLRSYFVAPEQHTPRIHRLVDLAFDFEVIATGTEQQALILENTLIKRHRPRFNVRLRDDKNYLYFRLPRPRPGNPERVPEETAARLAAYPRPTYSRRLGSDGARYFGPYTDAKSLRRTVRELRQVFPFRGCADAVFRRGRVCLDYHLGICVGPCEGLVTPGAYAALLDDAAAFMEGRTARVTQRLRGEMERAAGELDFERAGALRDRLRVVEKLTREQVSSPRLGSDVDVLGVASEGGQGVAAVLLVRGGRLQGMEHHPLEGLGEVAPEELLDSFVGQHYGSSTSVPKAVYLAREPSSRAVLEQFLSSLRGSRVELRVPQRGRFLTLLRRAEETAAAALRQTRVAQDFDAARTDQALEELRAGLGLERPPRRIECYDISNTMGEESVGSMVVFEQGRPKPSDYRIFAIRTVEGPNDFASIEEVLGRRFAHLRRDDEEDSSFGIRPDLVIIDGGQGQLAAAHRAMAGLGLADVPHFGLAKRFEELWPVGAAEPIHLTGGGAAFFLVQRVRDEAHRFAITHHRARRAKAEVRSRLDEIGGLGPQRKRALLRRFGSLSGIREASAEELAEVPGISATLAAAIKELV